VLGQEKETVPRVIQLFPFLELNKLIKKGNIHVFSNADLQHGKKFIQFPLYNFYRVPALQALLAKSHK